MKNPLLNIAAPFAVVIVEAIAMFIMVAALSSENKLVFALSATFGATTSMGALVFSRSYGYEGKSALVSLRDAAGCAVVVCVLMAVCAINYLGRA